MKPFFKLFPSIFVLAVFAFLTAHYFDENRLESSIKQLFRYPVLLGTVLAVYFLSFCLKAAAWQSYLKGKVRFSTCLIGILYSLLINHLSPVKAGDLVRVKIANIRESSLAQDEAFHSVVVLRLLDMGCLAAMAAAGLWILNVQLRPSLWLAAVFCFACLLVLLAARRYAPEFLSKHIRLFKKAFAGKNGLFIVACTLLSWVLEAGILYGTTIMLKGEIAFLAAVFANSVTVAGQIFQITPGGIGNYESFLMFALAFFEFSGKESYTIAVVTHALKFLFSYLAGAFVFLLYPISFNTLKEWTKARRVKEK